MNKLTHFAAAAIVGICFLSFTPKANAQVSFGIQIGPQPVCPYGYFDYAPYRCAPYGYYGPEWFANGVFIGAGPWYDRDDNFRGHIDRHFDPRFGYRGRLPRRGERPDWDRQHGKVEHFHGHEMHEERPHHDRDHNHGHDHH